MPLFYLPVLPCLSTFPLPALPERAGWLPEGETFPDRVVLCGSAEGFVTAP